jgi:hypothetical protein
VTPSRLWLITNYLTIDRYSTEYIALLGSFLFVGLEAIIRVLTLALRE